MERKKILIVDDVEINRDILEDIFEDDFGIVTAQDGIEAMQMLNKYKNELAAVLLDIYMPNMDGKEVLEKMYKKSITKMVPVLMITTDNSYVVEKECLKLGATDFIRKPFNESLVKARVMNVVSLFSYKNDLEVKVKKQTAKIEATNHEIVAVLGNLVESRNLESGEHVQRVSDYTRILAELMLELYPDCGLTPKRIKLISEAATLHDIGKIAIEDRILLKPGRLTAEEFDEMKKHTTEGAEIIKRINRIWGKEYGRVCYEIAKYHHEKYDGKGYPEGLSGDEIPLSAQLVSVADVYDALTSERCYKKAFTAKEAYEMIINGECGTFSPKLIDCFKKGFPFNRKRRSRI